MENFKKTIANLASKDLEMRKNCYSPAAEAYNKARLINNVVNSLEN